MLRWLFEDDADDLISSLRALEPYIDQEMYSVTIAAALTKREDKQYIVNRKILERIVNPETYRKAILSIIKRMPKTFPSQKDNMSLMRHCSRRKRMRPPTQFIQLSQSMKYSIC
ncbi:hypothetical protein NRBB27_0478 [Bifidobacterium breve]|nr:hypothetical protein NRBB27_0478 [Bifidobacterium breve]